MKKKRKTIILILAWKTYWLVHEGIIARSDYGWIGHPISEIRSGLFIGITGELKATLENRSGVSWSFEEDEATWEVCCLWSIEEDSAPLEILSGCLRSSEEEDTATLEIFSGSRCSIEEDKAASECRSGLRFSIEEDDAIFEIRSGLRSLEEGEDQTIWGVLSSETGMVSLLLGGASLKQEWRHSHDSAMHIPIPPVYKLPHKPLHSNALHGIGGSVTSLVLQRCSHGFTKWLSPVENNFVHITN